MLRALFHLAARTYYRWALNGMHPTHPDAGFVQLMHALHSAQLDAFLRTGR
ncbi:MAG TPA: hypothetical protein PKV98_16285 [Burkholderiaceae bacterium]|nr:hypothetical protein [Burkholderiaceae bacterium]